jgi:glyoxylase-like metal-dependent hydrolase (beta-lactamase superfamily II)
MMPTRPQVEPFFDSDTSTFTYVVYDHDGGSAAVIDPVLDYDPVRAATSTRSADTVIQFLQAHSLHLAWILETHAHADHLSSAGYLHDCLGAPIGIGRGIVQVQQRFKPLFGLGDDFMADGRQFDRLFDDGDQLELGSFTVHVFATPGHTGDSMTYLIGDAAFVGDTVFSPRAGTARTDFPGGNAEALYESIQKIFALPAETRIFLCHDYPADTSAPIAECTIAQQRESNVHLVGKDMQGFVRVRRSRDATLAAPRLILPALQVNIRGGRLPDAAADGVRYLQLPVDLLGAKT